PCTTLFRSQSVVRTSSATPFGLRSAVQGPARRSGRAAGRAGCGAAWRRRVRPPPRPGPGSVSPARAVPRPVGWGSVLAVGQRLLGRLGRVEGGALDLDVGLDLPAVQHGVDSLEGLFAE